EDTGDALGSQARRAVRHAGEVERSGRAEAPVRPDAADLRRAPADDLLRRAARVRGQLDARRQRDAGPRASPDALVAGHADGDGSMIGYIIRRLLFAIVLVFAVSSASLMLARLAPGDFVSESLGPGARREAIEEARARYGLNRSFLAQYR